VEIDDCHVCQYVQQSIDSMFDMSPDQFEGFCIECCWKQSWRELHEKDTVYFVMYKPSIKKEPVWNYRHLFRLRLWPQEVFGHHFKMELASDSIESALPEKLSIKDFDRNDKPITRALARTWHWKCKRNEDEKHWECNRQDHGYLPTRLLDVQHAIKTSQLRLVCLQSKPSLFTDRKYATLSHCWGTWGASENPVLTSRNIGTRQEVGLIYSSVPQTFQDAVTVAHWLQSKHVV